MGDGVDDDEGLDDEEPLSAAAGSGKGSHAASPVALVK
jgi:hypothetical protein